MKEDGNVQPIDEDEQDEIIAAVTHDFKRQVDKISKMMSIGCVGAIVATVISTTLHHTSNHGEHQRIIQLYPLFSILIESLAFKMSKSLVDMVSLYSPQHKMKKITKNDENTHILGSFSRMEEFLGIIGLVFIVLYMILFSYLQVTDILLWSLTFTNTMILIGSLLLRYDTSQTIASINDLKSHKYKFKTL